MIRRLWLKDLMGLVDDETFVRVRDPHRIPYTFLAADLFGGDKDVLSRLKPLEGLEVQDSLHVEIDDCPGAPGALALMLCIDLVGKPSNPTPRRKK